MASYINVFLKTEITVIPSLLDKYIGKYYNNTLCNGATWMFLSWYILHVIFDDLLNALLRKMRYKEYVRIRLKRSLWYLGFYSTACIYCIATFFQNDIKFYNVKNPYDDVHTSSHLILGFIVLSTFYLHSAIWERLKYCYHFLALNYLTLFLLMCFSYFLRFVEGTFRLTVLISVTQIALELARCSAILIKQTGFNRKIFGGSFFACSIFFFIINYLVVISLLLDPLLRKFSSTAITLIVFLISWLILDIYNSILFKTALHWLNHKEKQSCEKDILECALFPPRNDATYNFLILRKELKEREEKCLLLRRPKNRNVVFQTLKCMVAIKRKLHEKRQANNVTKEYNDVDDVTEDHSYTSEKNVVENSGESLESNNSEEKNNKNDLQNYDKSVHEEYVGDDNARQVSTENVVDDTSQIHAQSKNTFNLPESNGHIKKYKED